MAEFPIDIETATSFLKHIVPEWEWLLRHIESGDGRLRFPPMVARAIVNLKIESYPLLYENEAAIGLIMLRAFMSEEEMIELNTQLTEQSLAERSRTLLELLVGVEDVEAMFELPKTPVEERCAQAQFDAMSEEDQAQAIKIAQYLWVGFLAGFFQNVSIMVHGEKLTALVSRAKGGDDDALCKAVQIDKRILTRIPYFQQRLERATIEGDRDFLDGLAYRLQCPPYRGKIRHKSLWMAFSFLSMAGLLDILTHTEILDLCNDVGVGGYKNRIEDVKNLSKRLAEFRRFQQRGIVSTP